MITVEEEVVIIVFLGDRMIVYDRERTQPGKDQRFEDFCADNIRIDETNVSLFKGILTGFAPQPIDELKEEKV